MIEATVSTPLEPTESAVTSMLIQLVYPLIDRPERCSVQVRKNGELTTFVVYVALEDLETFSGRNARTGKSLQVILNAVGTKARRRFSLNFAENNGDDAQEKAGFRSGKERMDG